MSKAIIPTGNEFMREALIVIGGALLAAFVLSKLPALKRFIQNNTASGCDCDNH